MGVFELATAEVELIVSAVPTPVLVADYTPIIERFQGLEADDIRRLLLDSHEVFDDTLTAPRAIAGNGEWARLYDLDCSPIRLT